MKPFDLQKAIAGEPLVTRDGRGVTEFFQFKTKRGQQIAAIIEGDLLMFSNDGKWASGTSPDDLFMAPKMRTAWVNVYESRLNTVRNHGNCSAAFDTEEYARENARHNGIRTLAVAVPVEIED